MSVDHVIRDLARSPEHTFDTRRGPVSKEIGRIWNTRLI